MGRIVLLAVAMFLGTAAFNTPTAPLSQETYVYICTGQGATRYHSSDSCRGLKKCGGDIKKVTLKYAKEKEKTPCKICYKS